MWRRARSPSLRGPSHGPRARSRRCWRAARKRAGSLGRWATCRRGPGCWPGCCRRCCGCWGAARAPRWRRSRHRRSSSRDSGAWNGSFRACWRRTADCGALVRSRRDAVPRGRRRQGHHGVDDRRPPRAAERSGAARPPPAAAAGRRQRVVARGGARDPGGVVARRHVRVVARLGPGAGPAQGPLARGARRAGLPGGRARHRRMAAPPAPRRGRSRSGDAGAGRPLRQRDRGHLPRRGGRRARRGPLRRLAAGRAPGWRAGMGTREGRGDAVSSKIAVLPSTVADQIAAGEVVERPASVVKELVENALDAGARAVRVDLEDGGKTLIRVSDDGEGMVAEDARLALQRHATSKIRSTGDLIGVGTFGFRGEALPAIASVSRFELETSVDGRAAIRLRVVGGRVEAGDETARQRGTTVTVRGLFFNTPARRKFLRAPATETRAASEALSLLALARPDVAIALTSDGRAVTVAPPVERVLARVHAMWGRGLAPACWPLAQG